MSKLIYITKTRREQNQNTHKLNGEFPTIEMADSHIRSWPSFISSNFFPVEVKEVNDDYVLTPPIHMTSSVAKAFQEYGS